MGRERRTERFACVPGMERRTKEHERNEKTNVFNETSVFIYWKLSLKVNHQFSSHNSLTTYLFTKVSPLMVFGLLGCTQLSHSHFTRSTLCFFITRHTKSSLFLFNLSMVVDYPAAKEPPHPREAWCLLLNLSVSSFTVHIQRSPRRSVFRDTFTILLWNVCIYLMLKLQAQLPSCVP